MLARLAGPALLIDIALAGDTVDPKFKPPAPLTETAYYTSHVTPPTVAGDLWQRPDFGQAREPNRAVAH